MSETKSDITDEIRDLLDIPEWMAGSSQLRSGTLEKAVEAVGGDPWGGAPSLRGQLRKRLELVDGHEQDSSALRKAELATLRDELQDGDRDG